EEPQRARDVLRPLPAVAVRAALALAPAAGVVHEDAVAMADEHPGVAGRALAIAAAAVHEEHRGAVARRPVPAADAQPVARAERDVAVGGVGRRADRGGGLVGV